VQAEEQIGYVVTNSTSGTRLNQSVKELPMPIEIISSDFIDDTGAESLDDALEFSAGLETDLQSIQAGDNNQASETPFRLRGFVQEAALRNGFKRIGGVDTFNISRVDVVRGPNALLYGVGNFGGVVNYITARPSGTPRYRSGLSIGSYNDIRWSGEATGPITGNLGYSLSLLAQSREAWFDHQENEKIGIAPVVEWKPFENTTLTFDLEYLQRENSRVISPFYRADTEGTFTDPNTGATVNAPIDYMEESGLPTIAGEGFFRPGSGDEFRIGTDGYTKREDLGFQFNAIQKFGDQLSVQAGYYYTVTEREDLTPSFALVDAETLINSATPDTRAQIEADLPWLNKSTHPDADLNDRFGNLTQVEWSRSEEKQTRHQFRLEAVYKLPITDWWANSFVVGATYNYFYLNNRSYKLVQSDRPQSGNYANRFEEAVPDFKSPKDLSNFNFNPGPGEIFAANTVNDLGNIYDETGAYFIHQGKFLQNRIRTVTGYRYDASGVRRANTDKTTGIITSDPEQEALSSTNFSFGISAQLDEDSPWAVYFLTAGALQPIYGQTDILNNLIENTQGNSLELGLKFDVTSKETGRPLISGTMAIYEVERIGVLDGNLPVTPLPEAEREENAGTNGLRDDVSRGLDAQIIFTDLPIKNLQTIFNFSYNDYEIIRNYGVSYEEVYPGNGISAVDPNKEFPFPEDRRNNGTPEFTAKMWTKYEFKDGPLEGLNLAGGVRWIDEREAEFGLQDDDTFIILEPQTYYDFAIGYKNSFRDLDYNIRFNISNVANNDGIYGYGYKTPRSYRLSVNINF
jgi:outer membrane receptor protein involved in Fe transport